MTALPIIETQAGDISAYIPTNVISITDGQIFLDSDLFRAGVRPAVNGGLSVSRVGGSAQTRAMRKASGQLRLELAQYRELQIFAQFSSDMDVSTQNTLEYGAMLTEILKQSNGAPLPMSTQVVLLYAVGQKLLPHGMSLEKVRAFKTDFPEMLKAEHPLLLHEIETTGVLNEENEKTLRAAVTAWTQGAMA